MSGVKSFGFTGAGVSATTGDVLAFALSDPDDTGTTGFTNTADSYPRGSRVSSNNGGATWNLNPTDSNFKTFVIGSRLAVPSLSPTGIALLGSLMGLAGWRRLRS
jgi:hypothetical protein